MKVKELIEKLQTVNPEWTVLYSWEDEEIAFGSSFYNEATNLIQGEYFSMGFLDTKSLTPNAIVLGEK